MRAEDIVATSSIIKPTATLRLMMMMMMMMLMMMMMMMKMKDDYDDKSNTQKVICSAKIEF